MIMRKVLQVYRLLFTTACILRFFLSLQAADALASRKSPNQTINPKRSSLSTEAKNQIYSFSVELKNARPKPDTLWDNFIELWNDPRPITSIIASEDRSIVGEQNENNNDQTSIPYCIISDVFSVQEESFQILLYPRGRFVSDYSKEDDVITGPASAYLRYLPKQYGDEIDIAWKLKLVAITENGNGNTKQILSVATSGGLPKSNDTWSAAMTFCTELEAVESVGRATDWGSSSWSAREVCNAIRDNQLIAEAEITVFDIRSGESSFAWPPLSRGAVGAVKKAALTEGGRTSSEDQTPGRIFRVGEVIVPRQIQEFANENQALKEQFVYPGVDYRIMTMTDKDGNAIFSTESLDCPGQARLALRPCGWKLQQQLWQKNGKRTDWPVEVKAELLSKVTSTRFNPESALPRIISAFQRDWKAYTLALAVAMAPIPLALLARVLVSFYVIPSSSMEPTLLKGDVLLVEKFPGIYERTNRGDVILFQPPSALREIVANNGSQLSSTSLFVKRIVGLPGDKNIHLVRNGDELDTKNENDVLINGEIATGPDRNLCQDEPLRLIDKLLLNGKGKDIEELGVNDVYVLGDCKSVSVDSRVFGILPKENIVGKPIARIWPLDRFRLSGKF